MIMVLLQLNSNHSQVSYHLVDVPMWFYPCYCCQVGQIEDRYHGFAHREHYPFLSVCRQHTLPCCQPPHKPWQSQSTLDHYLYNHFLVNSHHWKNCRTLIQYSQWSLHIVALKVLSAWFRWKGGLPSAKLSNPLALQASETMNPKTHQDPTVLSTQFCSKQGLPSAKLSNPLAPQASETMNPKTHQDPTVLGTQFSWKGGLPSAELSNPLAPQASETMNPKTHQDPTVLSTQFSSKQGLPSAKLSSPLAPQASERP